MKNIHILPTDKPSKLAYDFNKLILNSKLLSPTLYKNQNIYITNDEEIKEGDSFTDDNNSLKRSYKLSHVQFANPKTIILTTDQDLIKDGVQAIDDEFLQWFVKNPSCERVKVVFNNRGITGTEKILKTFGEYKIIIPQEDPDRLAIPLDCAHDIVIKYGVAECQNCGLEESKISKQLTDLEIAIKLEEIEREEPKQTDENGKPITYWGGLEEPKQETLEEAATNYTIDFATMSAFKLGAKWQAERMYSEEDMVNFNEWTTIMYPNQRRFLTTSDKRGFYTTKELLTKWFSQFKKQNNEQ